jgi:hypothetical protein
LEVSIMDAGTKTENIMNMITAMEFSSML